MAIKIKRWWYGSRLVVVYYAVEDHVTAPIWWATDKLARLHERSAR